MKKVSNCVVCGANDNAYYSKYKCRKCYSKENRERLNKQHRQYTKTPKYKKYIKKYMKKMRKEKPDIIRKHENKYHYANLHKRNVKAKLHRAVKTGKIIRPDECMSCGVKCYPEGHHVDYMKPLDVVWLCRKCHYDVHLIKEV